MSTVVIEFITLDGVVSDPDPSTGAPHAGWAFRHGPEPVSGDAFRLGSTLDEGVLLLGRRTWELFARIWPHRDDPFAARMNAAAKLVASRSLADEAAGRTWPGSRVVAGDLVDAARREERDVVVMGSVSVVRALLAADLVDEYRLLTFPTVLGDGERLFPAGSAPAELECLAVEQAGAAVRTRYRRVRA
ncbi:dihydrofolate reductase family protein [Isoptericola sp. NPDC057653]|uniref:dihydrofolate reductase family protein n=1 Tax=Isoptericola sp. NPDC057653 TaxID=3346195 RepID=UPI0036C2F592